MNNPQPRSAVTLKDIARKLGLCHSSVSKALRNDPEISEATRQRVQSVASEMGYKPNAMAAGLAHFKRDSKDKPIRATLAWLNFWPDPKQLRSYKEFDGYWKGANASAEKFGYRLEEFVCNKITPDRLEKVLLARGINGILLPPHQNPIEWGDFHWENFSVVRFGRSLPTPCAHVVTADQTANGMMAFAAILARGYQRIGLVTGQERGYTHNARRWLFQAGFLMAQSELDERGPVPILFLNMNNPGMIQAEFERWLKQHRPDAVITDHAILTDMLRKAGYRVPEDIGLAVNSVLDGNADSGISQQPEEIGRVAVLVLLSLIHDNDRGLPPNPREILIKGAWVDGSSLPNRA